VQQVETHVTAQGLALFHSLPRAADSFASVMWDAARYPDYRMFLAAAVASGARLISVHSVEFTDDMVDEALERLEAATLPSAERRSLEMRLNSLRRYTGFTCEVELSFDVAPRVYIFEQRTEWFEQWNEMLDEIEDSEDDSESLNGGFFTQN
jgi:hypothetical protein